MPWHSVRGCGRGLATASRLSTPSKLLSPLGKRKRALVACSFFHFFIQRAFERYTKFVRKIKKIACIIWLLHIALGHLASWHPCVEFSTIDFILSFPSLFLGRFHRLQNFWDHLAPPPQTWLRLQTRDGGPEGCLQTTLRFMSAMLIFHNSQQKQGETPKKKAMRQGDPFRCGVGDKVASVTRRTPGILRFFPSLAHHRLGGTCG